MSDFKDDLEDGDEGLDSAEDGDSESPSTEDKSQKSTDKRIRDLQSKADQETARANKLEKRLADLQKAMTDSDAEESNPKPKGDGDATNAVVLDMARMFAYQQNPKLAEYGLSSSDLTGSSPSEIAESASELLSRFGKIETQVRNKVLAENGLAPEVDAGSPPPPKRDFSNMSSEDFQKVLDKALGG